MQTRTVCFETFKLLPVARSNIWSNYFLNIDVKPFVSWFLGYFNVYSCSVVCLYLFT